MSLVAVPLKGEQSEVMADSVEKPQRSLWAFVWNICSIVFLLAVLVIAAVSIVIPKATGAIPMTILSNSMAPNMPVGSLAVVKPTLGVVSGSDSSTLSADDIVTRNNTCDLKIGDIIAFQPNAGDSTLVIHRIIGVAARADGSREFTAQGDNNSGAEIVEDYMIRGKVWYSLPHIGYINNFVNSDSNLRRIVLMIIIVGLYGWAGLLAYRALATRRQVKE